jgi:hypothetical protein
MNQPSIQLLPEATFEEVTTIQRVLEQYVMMGLLVLNEERTSITYFPRVPSNLVVVRRHGDESIIDEYENVTMIKYPIYPSPSSKLLVNHFYHQYGVSELNTAGIINLTLTLKQNEPTE